MTKKMLAELVVLWQAWRAYRRYKRTGRRNGGFGSCFRCGLSWNNDLAVGKQHYTRYKEGHSCFPLCEDCWGVLSPEQRIPFYMALVLFVWRDPSSRRQWLAIEHAVLSGL